MRSLVREGSPTLITYSLVRTCMKRVTSMLGAIVALCKLRLITLTTSNKRYYWVADEKRARKLGRPPIIASVSRYEHAKDNELDTYERDQFSGRILYGGLNHSYKSRIARCV